MAVMKTRALHLVLGLGCFALVGFAVIHLQQSVGLLPCPLCVLQRIAYLLFGATALLAALRPARGGGRWRYFALLEAWALAGAAIAAWQVYLTYHPQAAECGISAEERFLNGLPLAQWWPALFEANGDCTKVDWTFLGLSVPELSLIAFIVLGGTAIVAARRPASR